jgi:hypothetical protein
VKVSPETNSKECELLLSLSDSSSCKVSSDVGKLGSEGY